MGVRENERTANCTKLAARCQEAVISVLCNGGRLINSTAGGNLYPRKCHIVS